MVYVGEVKANERPKIEVKSTKDTKKTTKK